MTVTGSLCQVSLNTSAYGVSEVQLHLIASRGAQDQQFNQSYHSTRLIKTERLVNDETNEEGNKMSGEKL